MDTFLIIGVAADAGDLDAVSELLFALPAECGAAIIIAQHFDARRTKSLAALIARQCDLPVTLPHDGAEPERNHVYLLPANATLTVPGASIRAAVKQSLPVGPGDGLFTSLAQLRGSGAVGVVLSGTGADGACGVRAIKQEGGTTFAQYPGSGRFPSMPISAIETGHVDFVLRPYEIARELARLSRAIDASVRCENCVFVVDEKGSRPVIANAAAGAST